MDFQPHIPGAVLTGHVFPFLGVKSLSRACLVCREWRDAADQDVLWKTLCARKWKTKMNVPRIVLKDSPFLTETEKAGEPATLFPLARYGERTELKVKDLKQILQLRGIDFSSMLERSQFMNAVLASQPKSIMRWTGAPKSKWKAAYIGAAHAALRPSITRTELVYNTWRLTFKAQMQAGAEVHHFLITPFVDNSQQAGWTAQFQADGRYTSNPAFQQNALEWKVASGAGGQYEKIQVGNYPPLTVGRTADWGYTLENEYVVFFQVGSPAAASS